MPFQPKRAPNPQGGIQNQHLDRELGMTDGTGTHLDWPSQGMLSSNGSNDIRGEELCPAEDAGGRFTT